MEANVAVVIPNFKASLTANEEISLTQVKKVLGKYDLYFILPDSVKIDYGCREIREQRYPDVFFSSVHMYSRFMLMPELYESFSNYDYILICQLDAFVFEDRLKDFCSMKYDYIGAPWTDGIFFKKNEKEKMWYVGNGGLSLRKVEAFLRWIKKGDFVPYVNFINEDLLIAVFGTGFLNIAPMDVALSFSFETNCDVCIKLTNGKLPFGCHAWAKYDPAFWKPFIEKYGYSLESVENKESCAWQRKMNEFCNNQYDSKLKSLLPTSYRSSKEGIYIWGVGRWGISLLEKLIENGILVEGFIDHDETKCGKEILSCEIIHPSSLIHNKKSIIVAIQNNFIQVEKQLQEQGYQKGIDYITLQDLFEKLGL